MTESKKGQLRAIKLKRKGDEGYIPEITLHDPELKADKFVQNCENLCHNDLVKAISRLNHHLAVRCDQIESSEFECSDMVDEFIIARGYSLSGADDELRIVIKGHRKIKDGGAFSFNAPVIWLNQEDEEKQYIFLDDLKEKLKRIEAEAMAYLFEGKKYEDPQLSLNMPDGKVTKAQIADPATPEEIVDDIVRTANKGKKDEPKKRRVPQSSKHKDGLA